LIGQVQIDGTQSVAAATDLADIDNVSSATPSDGQALVYDSSLSQWKPGTVASSGGTSVTANHAYQQRDEQYKIDIPARSGTNPQWTAITDGTTEFSVTITPSSANSKIELNAIVAFSQARNNELGESDEDSKKLFTVFAFKRGSTTLLPSASGNRTGTLAGGDYNDLDWPAAMHTTELRYFDEPGTTSPLTYTVVVGNRHTSTIDFQWNRSPASLDNGYHYDGLSTFSAQEIDAAPQLSNVSTTGAQAGQALVYNSSSQWVPGSVKNYNYASSTSNQDTTVSWSWSDVTGMPPITITPSSTSSIIKVSVDMYFEVSDYGHEVIWRLVRQESGQSDVILNTTQPTGMTAYTLGIPFTTYTNNTGTTIDGVKFKYIEVPGSTNQLTYKVQCRFPFNVSKTLHLNSTVYGTSGDNREYMTSWIEAEQMN
jgi:hypothetical protein